MAFNDWLKDALLAHDSPSYHTPYQAERALRLAEGKDPIEVFTDGKERPTRRDRAFLVRALREALLSPVDDDADRLVDRLEAEVRLATAPPAIRRNEPPPY